MKIPVHGLTICNLLRARAKIKSSGGMYCRINGKKFLNKHLQMAKQILYIARLERRKTLEKINSETETLPGTSAE